MAASSSKDGSDNRSSCLTFNEFLSRQAAVKAAVGVKTEVEIKAKIKPPPRSVRTIRELIYWEYAKLIAKAAGFERNYGFIMSRFTKLKNQQIHISDITKDDERAMMKERECIYCGSKDGLTIDHIIPLIKGGLADTAGNKVLLQKM